MISKEQQLENKSLFIDTLRNAAKEKGYLDKIDELIGYLENETDFFIAPASTKYHSSYEGGLCQHSLNVYDNLSRLVQMKGLKNSIDSSSIKIVALLHDISKTNFYEMSMINKKVYSPNGSKSDNMGRFDWVSEPSYKVIDFRDRFLYSSHGANSEKMISSFIPLTIEESCAIINHHSVYDNPNLDVTPIFDRYSLATLLHIADMLATYIDESLDAEQNEPVNQATTESN